MPCHLWGTPLETHLVGWLGLALHPDDGVGPLGPSPMALAAATCMQAWAQSPRSSLLVATFVLVKSRDPLRGGWGRGCATGLVGEGWP